MEKLLKKLNLLDTENNLSLTNIAVIVILVKLILTPTWSLNEAGMLLIGMTNYMHKRSVIADSKDEQ